MPAPAAHDQLDQVKVELSWATQTHQAPDVRTSVHSLHGGMFIVEHKSHSLPVGSHTHYTT
jgi:hypothetical protein